MSGEAMNGLAASSMRILEIETFGRGGLIHYVHNLSCALAARGHEVTIATSRAYELDACELPSNVRLVKATARVTHRERAWLPAGLLGSARKVEAIIDACAVAWLAHRLRPDVVHLHSTNPIALAYLMLLRRFGLPVAVTAHVVTAHERTPVQDSVSRRIHQRSSLVIAHSDFDRRRLLEEFSIDPDRVTVIPHGEYGFFGHDATVPDRQAARRSLGLEPHHEVALFFGYIREYKGLDLLFDAWPAIVEARPAARLVVAGDPVRLDAARRAQLEDWATRLGAIHRFAYVPFSDVTRYFAAADAIVMPYRHVSQSGVLFVALSLGLPIVAARVGGLPEVLRDGESALLVEPESPAALTKALVRVLGDPGLRDRLSVGGRRVAAQHSWPRIAERTELAFRQLVARASRAQGS